jgi:hypothetical protein
MPAVAAAQSVRGGVQGGLAFSNLSNLENAIDFGGPVDIGTRRGIVVGAFVTFEISDTFAVQPEVLFVAQGATPTDGSNELRIKLGYVDIPILARFTPVRNSPFYVVVGPSVNFNVSATAVDVVPAETEEDIKDDVKAAEFGLMFGAGLSIRRFFVEGRYLAGLTDITDDPDFDASVRNRAFAILVGARF